MAKKKASTDREMYLLLINWWIKMVAGILYAWMFVYYYGGGDFVGYKERSDQLLNSILENWRNIKYLFLPVKHFRDYILSHGYSNASFLTIEMAYYTDNNFMTSRIGCISGFFTFNRFLITGLVFSNLAYYGCVYIYLALKKIIRGYDTTLLLSCLFVPSCVFWGNGWAKEPICVLALGIIFNYSVKLFFEKKINFKNILLVYIFGYILLATKDYIFYSFLLAFFSWKIYTLIKPVLSASLIARIYFWMLITGLVFVVNRYFAPVIFGFIVGTIGNIIATNIGSYERMASATQGGGSLIAVSNIDVSNLSSVLTFIPQAIVNIFFRPFPWEITNVLMIFTVLENLFFVFLFMRVLIKTRLFTTKAGIQNNYHVFAIVFSVVLALLIGISTFNFGSMVRYKIPLIPFWASFLLILDKKLTVNKGAVYFANAGAS